MYSYFRNNYIALNILKYLQLMLPVEALSLFFAKHRISTLIKIYRELFQTNAIQVFIVSSNMYEFILSVEPVLGTVNTPSDFRGYSLTLHGFSLEALEELGKYLNYAGVSIIFTNGIDYSTAEIRALMHGFEAYKSEYRGLETLVYPVDRVGEEVTINGTLYKIVYPSLTNLSYIYNNDKFKSEDLTLFKTSELIDVDYIYLKSIPNYDLVIMSSSLIPEVQ